MQPRSYNAAKEKKTRRKTEIRKAPYPHPPQTLKPKL